MAAVAFDSLDYAHQLEAAGMPRKQAEVVAKGLTTMFIHNFDSLVTKDYLDSRFTEFETRVDANINRRFVEVNRRIDKMGSQIDVRFADFRLQMQGEIGVLRGKLNLHAWMLALLLAGTFKPILQDMFS